MANIVVLGSGGWGIALGIIANLSGNQVTLWTPFEDEYNMLSTKRESEKLLRGVKIPKEIEITTDLSAVDLADMVILAVPSFAVGETAKKLKNHNVKLLVNVAKGLEKNTLKRLSEVIEEQLPNTDIVVLSGPSHAEEVARKEPTSLVAASKNIKAAEYVQEALMCETLRIYTGDDLVGVELGGAFKNIIAVAAGICDGIGLGDNPKAALITRGLAEITRLGITLGAKGETFSGLAGIGDLIVTCTSTHSRNHRFGEMIGRGVGVEEALRAVGTVEGYHAAEIAYKLSKKVNVEMPITAAIYFALYNGRDILETIKMLMTRPCKQENEKSWLTK